jgi:hypothetical protein
MSLLGLPGAVSLVVFYVLLAIKIFAFVSALLYSSEAYRAAGKWTKPGWVAVTGVAAFFQVVPLGGFMIVNLALTIAALVYLADVRPALAGLRRR